MEKEPAVILERVPEVLDVTLRDGSYSIDFQFTAEDTSKIAAALETVGLRWIEVGHGLGLNASNAGKGRAAASDEEYMEAAAQAIRLAKWGMFCIPGIARLKDLDLAAQYKMSFVRVGSNITELERAQPFVERAKERGLIVSYNAMKSYAVSPEEFGRRAAVARSWGADIVCLVDSAGGMFPNDVAAYYAAAKSESEGYLGFHAHNNLTMAMANSLAAIESGAVLVDSSLQGMGRSAGNTVTEALVAILKQRGHLEELDLKGIMDIGQGLIAPLVRGRSLDPMAVTSGYALFHSSFASKVKRYAGKYDLDVRDVIMRLTQEDLVDAPDDLLERIGKDLAAVKIPRRISIPAFSSARAWPKSPIKRLEVLVRDLRPRAVKMRKFSALNVVIGEQPMAEMRVSGNIQNTPAHVVGSVTLTDEEQLVEALKAADGLVDVVFLDVDRKPHGPGCPGQTARRTLKQSQMLTYFDSQVWISAVEDQAVRLLSETLDGKVAVIIGDHPKSRFLALRLSERLAEVLILGDGGSSLSRECTGELSMMPSALGLTALSKDEAEAAEWLRKADLVVAWTMPPETCDAILAGNLATKALVLDAGMGLLSPDCVREAHDRGAKPVRLDIWPALAAALESAHESDRVQREDFGWAEISGVRIVAGGAIGQPGDVVVDSVRHPTRVIGLVDGRGRITFDFGEQDAERVRLVREEINRIQVAPKV